MDKSTELNKEFLLGEIQGFHGKVSVTKITSSTPSILDLQRNNVYHEPIALIGHDGF